jgi:SAM-dependent methyltransferase
VDLLERSGSDARHPWELERARFFLSLLARHANLADVRAVLDVGAGDGWLCGQLAADLSPSCRVVAWDIGYTPEDLSDADERIEWTTAAPHGAFDTVLLLDVLEHIEDPASFLGDHVVPRLADDAVVLVSVPAGPRLFGAHDRMLGHYRRYRRSELLDLISPFFDRVEDGPLFMSLVPMRAAQVMLGRRRNATEFTGVGAWKAPAPVTGTIRLALRADATAGATLARMGLPLRGLSHWVVCRPRRRR